MGTFVGWRARRQVAEVSPGLGPLGDAGRGGRWQRCPCDGGLYGMEGRKAGDRGVPRMGTLCGVGGEWDGAAAPLGSLGTQCPDGVSILN